MKSYFAKKIIFAVLFTALLFAYSGWNLWESKDALIEVCMEESNITSFQDVSLLISDLDTAISKNLLGKMDFVEGYGLFQSMLGKEESNNFSFVKDSKGFLHYASFYRERDTQIPEYAKRVRRLKENVQDSGTKVMFIAPPGKNLYGKTEFAEGIPVNDANPAVDELLMELSKNRVETLDLRDFFMYSDLPYEDIFFRTDHHWTPEAGLYASFEIIDTVQDKFGDEWDPDYYYRDIKRYHMYNYPDSMVGSMGRSAGINFAGTEDFVFVWPEYEGDFEWYGLKQNSGREFNRKGTFAQTFLLEDILYKSDPYKESRYGVYMSELTAYDKIINKDNPEGPKVLFIRDSYFSSVIPFLAPMCSEIEAVWSLNQDERVSVEDLVRENQYDYIFVEVYPNNIEDAAFSYFREE